MYEEMIEAIRKKTDMVPSIAVVLGSGLGGFADETDIEAFADYSDIPGFPTSTVEGHRGRFVFCHIGKTPVVLMQGRVHYYEGYPMDKVVLPIRIMRLLGAKVILLTNAAGGICFDMKPGDFMAIKDHISFLVPSPLRGKNIDCMGPRFPDMTNVYDSQLREIVKKKAMEHGENMREGVYAQLSGPNFETPAEIRLLRTLGADAVGMSTACEAIAAVHCGMRVCGISFISNLAAGLSETPLSHEEVQKTADEKAPVFRRIVRSAVEGFGDIL